MAYSVGLPCIEFRRTSLGSHCRALLLHHPQCHPPSSPSRAGFARSPDGPHPLFSPIRSLGANGPSPGRLPTSQSRSAPGEGVRPNADSWRPRHEPSRLVGADQIEVINQVRCRSMSCRPAEHGPRLCDGDRP
jgi:hypothetical protein